MSFDQNPPSPEKLVNTKKKTTKVNIGVVVGVLVFFVLGAGAVVWVAFHPPQERPTPLSTNP